MIQRNIKKTAQEPFCVQTFFLLDILVHVHMERPVEATIFFYGYYPLVYYVTLNVTPCHFHKLLVFLYVFNFDS